MITSTEAYARHKKAVQSDLDVVVLLCHAVPALNGYMKAVEGGTASKIPNPDHFKEPQAVARLKGIVPRYRKILGRLIFLSSFSYFEAYFNDVLDEMIKFHGDVERWASVALKRTMAAIVPADAKYVLREPLKKSKRDKYRKALKQLEDSRSYQAPSERLASFGILRLRQDLDSLKAYGIEDIATKALGLPIINDEWKTYHKFRDQRNGIAHGRVIEVDLKAAIDASQHLKQLAMRIDRHIVEHFLLIEDA